MENVLLRSEEHPFFVQRDGLLSVIGVAIRKGKMIFGMDSLLRKREYKHVRE